MDRILLAHGGGGEKTSRLIQNLFLKYFPDPVLRELDDAARLDSMVFTTDSFVVSPLFFEGGDIGRLCVSGTVNDIAVMGAKPLYLSLAFIIEEGFELESLERILSSIDAAARESGVRIVTGDTKVVERGKCDGIYITASGIGEPVFPQPPSFSLIRPGDAILINGPVGLHAMAIVAARKEFGFQASVKSDVSPLWHFIKTFSDCGVRFMRDPTRGGVAQVLNEISTAAGLDCEIMETEIPVPDTVRGYCELLGYDPLYLANEGKVIVVTGADQAEELLGIMKQHELGREARIIGRFKEKGAAMGRVLMRTAIGTERIVMPPMGELLPRIC